MTEFKYWDRVFDRQTKLTGTVVNIIHRRRVCVQFNTNSGSFSAWIPVNRLRFIAHKPVPPKCREIRKFGGGGCLALYLGERLRTLKAGVVAVFRAAGAVCSTVGAARKSYTRFNELLDWISTNAKQGEAMTDAEFLEQRAERAYEIWFRNQAHRVRYPLVWNQLSVYQKGLWREIVQEPSGIKRDPPACEECQDTGIVCDFEGPMERCQCGKPTRHDRREQAMPGHKECDGCEFDRGFITGSVGLYRGCRNSVVDARKVAAGVVAPSRCPAARLLRLNDATAEKGTNGSKEGNARGQEAAQQPAEAREPTAVRPAGGNKGRVQPVRGTVLHAARRSGQRPGVRVPGVRHGQQWRKDMTTKLELKRSIVVLARIIKTLCERLDSAEDAINHRPCDYLGNVSVGAQKKCDDIINFLGRDGDIRNVCYECGELTDEVFGCPKDCEER